MLRVGVWVHTKTPGTDPRTGTSRLFATATVFRVLTDNVVRTKKKTSSSSLCRSRVYGWSWWRWIENIWWRTNWRMSSVPFQTSGQENNVAPVSQPDVSMPASGPPETPATLLKRPMMIVRTLLNLSRTAAVHIGNGDQSTKCLLRNLVILW